LKLEDKKGQLAALVISHINTALPEFWEKFTARIIALYGKEFFDEVSKRVGYDYLAIHYHWYNRYAEWVRPIYSQSRTQ
jgi:hypothetical protein